MKLLRWFVIFLIVFFGYRQYKERPLQPPTGVIAANDPVQNEVRNGTRFSKNNYQLQTLAEFEIEARVLAKESYSTGRESDLSPLDLALGWGSMSDSAVLKQLSISQGNRFYFYQWENTPPRPPEEIAEHSANMHLIPSSAEIEKQMKAVRVGQVVKIIGKLVEVQASDGWRWRSSLTRKDTGNGACELIYVEAISVH
jgi:hypothetical protein